MAHPPPRRATLPSLASLDFHGASEYLEEFVAQIDLPTLCFISVKLFNQIFFEIPQFRRFICHLNALGSLESPNKAIIEHTVESVSVCLYREEKVQIPNSCGFRTSCRRFDWQLSFLTQISSELFPLLPGIRSFTISQSGVLPTLEDVDSTQWLDLFRLFTHVTEVAVCGHGLLPSVVQALGAEEMSTEILPELTSLFFNGYPEPLSDPGKIAAKQFVARRMSSSGRTVELRGLF